jgi:hypothetical protein
MTAAQREFLEWMKREGSSLTSGGADVTIIKSARPADPKNPDPAPA